MTVSEDQPASASPDTSPLLMDPVFNPTVMLIPSALNASKDLNSVFNVLPLRIELLSFLKVSVSAWMDSMQMPIMSVFLVEMDAVSAHQLLTVLPVLPWQLPVEMEFAHALKRPISLSQLTVLDTALPADHTATSALMPAPALPA